MKRIGILTMHRVINYGSFLQAYALKKLVANIINCDISFIDIKPGITLYENDNTFAKKLSRLMQYFLQGKIFQMYKARQYNLQISNQFRKSFYPLLGRIDSPDSDTYDCIIIGSDEVFHCCQRTPWGFTTQLYGDIANAKKIISYAASFGGTNLIDIRKLGLEGKITNSLKKMSAISVRDSNSFEIIKQLTQKNAVLNLDPVLIYGYSEEIKNSKDFETKDKFLLVYSYNGRISDKKEISEIKKFAHNNKLKIYTIFCKYDWADKCIIPDTPFDLLKVFQKAEYVVSDTFHGTIFSIITHKKFGTFIRGSSVHKLGFLLKELNLEDHSISDLSELENILKRDIDYQGVEIILNRERIKAREYLEMNI